MWVLQTLIHVVNVVLQLRSTVILIIIIIIAGLSLLQSIPPITANQQLCSPHCERENAAEVCPLVPD